MAPYNMVDMASILDSSTLAKRYYPAPDTMDPLTPTYRAGMIPLAVCALMSLFSVAALLGFITQRMISWRRHYRKYVGYNQYVILIFNLLIADLQQSISFSISFHWLRINKIVAPTGACFIQAWFLQIGDVASGFFVLAIAIHTWLGVVRGYKLPYVWFVVAILSIWFFALFLTVLGPAMHQERYFARAAAWVGYQYHKQQNMRKLTSNSAGSRASSKWNDCGFTTSGSSSLNSAQSSYMHTSSSTSAAASEASSQTTPASSHEQLNLWSCTPQSTWF